MFGVPQYDIDFYNIDALLDILDTTPLELRLSSKNQHYRMLVIGKKPSAMLGLKGAVQLVDEPPLFIRQIDHMPVLDELRQRGMILQAPAYKAHDYKRDENDADDVDGDADMLPVPFCMTTAYVTSRTLKAALAAAGVDTLRTTRYNGKTPIGEWIAAFAPLMVTNPWARSCLDISAVVRVEDGSRIALIGGTGRTTRIMEMCGALGQGCGSLFVSGLGIGDGLHVDAVTVYSGRLVHHLKARGMKTELPAHGSVRQAAAYRRYLVPFLEDWCDAVVAPDFDALGELRFEVRVTINHALFSGDLGRSRAPRRRVRHRRPRAALCGQAAAVPSRARVRRRLRRCSAAKLRALARPKIPRRLRARRHSLSINAVKLRLADVHAQAGVHPGLRLNNCVNRAAVQLMLDPSFEDVIAGGSIFDAGFQFVEPQLPPLPAPAPARERRAHVLYVGGRMSLSAMRAYLAAYETNRRQEQFGYQMPPVPHVVVEVPQRSGRLQARFGDAAQQAFAAQHPTLTPDESLRLQMLRCLNIIPKAGSKYTVKRGGRFFKGCTHGSVEKVLDYMMANHKNDWQEFDQRPDLQ